MRKHTGLISVAIGATAALALVVPGGNAQVPGSRTVTFYEPPESGTFAIVDNAPRSPAKNPESRRYHFSAGDEIVFSSHLLDKAGGTRVGTLYVKATVVSGKTFADIKALGNGVFELNDGSQIEVNGTFKFNGAVRVAVTGGTGNLPRRARRAGERERPGRLRHGRPHAPALTRFPREPALLPPGGRASGSRGAARGEISSLASSLRLTLTGGRDRLRSPVGRRHTTAPWIFTQANDDRFRGHHCRRPPAAFSERKSPCGCV
jgi:hypothetical protein